MPRSYPHIVSLGCDCRVAYNVRMTFGFSTAYPFDWWLTPLRSTVLLLKDPDPDKLYAPDLLEPVVRDGRTDCIVNSHYGIRLHHEFVRAEKGVIEDFRDFIARPKQRTAFLLNRLLSLPATGEPVLFVLNGPKFEGPEAADWRSRVPSLIGVLKDVLGFRDFDLLFVNTPMREPSLGTPPPRTIVETFADDETDWRGDIAAWRHHLRHAGEYSGPVSVRDDASHREHEEIALHDIAASTFPAPDRQSDAPRSVRGLLRRILPHRRPADRREVPKDAG